MILRWALGLTLLITGCVPFSEVGRVPGLTVVGQESGIGISAERVAIAVPPPAMPRQKYSQGSLWNSGPASLFGDRRARNLGDILTVVIEIDDKAQISNRSGLSRSGSGKMSIGALMGLPELVSGVLPEGTSLDPAANFSSTSTSGGDGSVSRNEKITLRIAATVVDVLANGHLVVSGLQEVRVNFELRELQVVGIVQPEDISRRNEITYDKIAGARISYGGRGRISEMQQPRYGQQIFEIVAPF
ncbi:MAG: flagellar basal body L-ring protein FlgH [Rhodobacteraceae bacterium]|nr:flagellar basal body L-ring protein FlgH [Paracoccaceae bacterium]